MLMCSSRKGISVTPTGCATNSCLFRKIKKYEQIGHLGQVFRGVMLNAYSHFFFSLFPTFAKAMNLYVYAKFYSSMLIWEKTKRKDNHLPGHMSALFSSRTVVPVWWPLVVTALNPREVVPRPVSDL